MIPEGDYRNPERREHFVYRAYDGAGQLLYVGCTMRLDRRWKEHRTSSEWARKARRFHVSGPFSYDTARRLEREALATEGPTDAMTPTRRAASNRNGRLQSVYLTQFLDAGLPMGKAIRKAIRKADQECPVPAWGVPA